MSAEERFTEFKERANELARELNLEIEFTIYSDGYGYLSCERPCIELVTTDTHEYVMVRGGLTFGGRAQVVPA